MAPGGNNYQDIVDPRTAFADYGIAPESSEFKGSPFRKSVAVGGKHGVGSNTAVHELLECPVCLNMMYPPIYQVGFSAKCFQLK